MRAGFAETVITPQCPVYIAGYAGGVRSTGVHDDLYASAVCLEDGEQRAMLISLDLIGYDEGPYARLRQAASDVAGVPQERVFLTCTHTHEGPNTRQLANGAPNPDYVPEYTDLLVQRVHDVARAAVANLRRFILGVNRAYVDENMNRRLFLNEEYRYPSRCTDLLPIAHAYGHADKELGVLYFYPAEGGGNLSPLTGQGDYHPFGAIANYTMHPLTAGRVSTLLSADVPGVMRALVRESLGCPLCYITGAAGTNHPRSPNTGFEETRRVGGVLGSHVIERCSDAHIVAEPVRMRGGSYALTLNYVTPEEYAAIPDVDVSARPRAPHKFYRPGEPVVVEYTLLALGPVLFVGVPGELAAELGSTLKWFSPFKRTYIMYNATANMGYISHPNAYAWGGYEPGSTRLSPESVRVLIHEIIEAMHTLSR